MKIKIESPVAVLGYGVEGKYAVGFLKDQGISDITVFDEKTSLEIPEDIKSCLGPDAFKGLKGFKTILRSPGVRYESADNVTSMTDLTMDIAKERVTAVTGSNGKTTTVGMLEAILSAHYKGKLIVGGNDRKPVLQEAIDKPNLPILMEVSSFQFADIHKSPHISAILNITPNHLDWHEDLEEYANAKANLIAHQGPNDWAVLNANNENSAKLARKAPEQICWLGKKTGKAWVVWEDDTIIAQFGAEPFTVLSQKDLTLKTHPDNVLCAVAVSLIHEVKPEVIRSELMKFKGVEHRLEFVREIEGVKFYNDSACTTPESTKVAIDAFPQGQLILLLGGSSKNAEFAFMAHHIVESETRVILYGKEGDRIREAIEGESGEYLILHHDHTGNFADIIKIALEKAGPHYNVVLSPACASFDMFQNSKQRGRLFAEIVMSL